jgi:DNA-binding transcriptional MerR regulator
MQIGKLARRAGVSTRAVRYYERIGLLGKPQRSASGYRVYGEESVAFLEFLRKAQKTGFTLREIKAIWEIRNTGGKPCGYVKEQARRKVEEIARKIGELEDLRTILRDLERGWTGASGDEDARICPLIEGKKSRMTGGS